ncbi:MAG: type VI secretion system tube protein Hcp [Pseudomonadota bacterium]
MAHDMFIKIDDIKGESSDAKHGDEIDILSWSWGVTQTGTAQVGRGGGAGKVQVNDLTITKYVDRASPILLKQCCSGKHMKTAVLAVRKAGGSPLEYLKITMEDLIISAVTHGGAGSDDKLTENVTLNFARVKFEYVPQKKDGSGDASIPMGWDIAGNVET